jgi:hypothetical protein
MQNKAAITTYYPEFGHPYISILHRITDLKHTKACKIEVIADPVHTSRRGLRGSERYGLGLQ